jgi:hypothetical protein
MTEKITDEELADLLRRSKEHGMGVCSKAVKLAQRCADVFLLLLQSYRYRNAAKRTSA